METNSFDLHELVRTRVLAALPQARAKGLSLDLILDAASPRWVFGNFQECACALSSLVLEAIDTTSHGGITIRVESVPKPGPCSDSVPSARITIDAAGRLSVLSIPDL